MEIWYWLSTKYACGGIIVDFEEGLIIKTCLIYQWMVGKTFDFVVLYLKDKRTFIEYRIL